MLTLTSKTTTFLVYLTLVLAATAIVEANDSPLQQRNHVQLKRIIKKRAAQIDFPIIIGAAPIPSAASSSTELPASSSSSEIISAAASSTSEASRAVSTASSSAQSSGSSAASSESSAASSSSSSGSSTIPTPSPQVTTSPAQQERSTSTLAGSTKTLTKSLDAAASAPPSMAGAAADDQNKSNIVTILIGIAASVGGVFIIWTVFRKWKLGSSKKFDKRLQPIDWEKPESTEHDSGIVPANRRHSGSSFNSSGHGSHRGFNNIPDHDFTAGPTHLSPVGGYADMSRGPSPGPQYGVPSHHQSGYEGRY